MKTYFHIQLLSVPVAIEEKLSSLCFDFGALGVSENVPLSPDTLDKPILIDSNTKNLDVFFEKEPQEAFYQEILVLINPDQIKGATQESKDWLEEWKKGYHSFKLVGDYWIVPSWEVPPGNVKPIFIDPGMAFGTGTHQTTQLCSELIFETIMQTKPNSMVDVGTGTAILAMLAKKMGVSHVIGTEIDHESVNTARENLTRNGFTDIEVIESDLNSVSGYYDLVVANIIDGVLLDIKNDLLRVLNKKGRMVLSGILTERDEMFIEDFLRFSELKILKRLQRDEWVAYLLESS